MGNRLSLVPGFTPDRPADGPGPEPTVLPWTDACPEVAAPGSGRAIKVLMIIEACGGGAGATSSTCPKGSSSGAATST